MSAGNTSSFGDRLRHHRESAGLTQERLAECAGILLSRRLRGWSVFRPRNCAHLTGPC